MTIRSAVDYLNPFRQCEYSALTPEHQDTSEGVVRCHDDKKYDALTPGHVDVHPNQVRFEALTPEHMHSLEKDTFLDRLYDIKDLHHGDLVVVYTSNEFDGFEWLKSHPNERDKKWFFICASGIVAVTLPDTVSGFWVKTGTKTDYKQVRELPYKAVDAYTKGSRDPTLFDSEHKFLILSRRANEMTVEEIKGIIDKYAEEFGTWGERLLVDNDNRVVDEG